MTDITAKKVPFSLRTKQILVGLVLVGVVTFVAGLFTDPERIWANYLLEYYLWLCMSLAGVFSVALQHITGSIWSAPLRRIPESFIAYLPIAVILFIGLLFGVHTLYEWTHHDVVMHDPILRLKTGYLNIPFFIVRNLLLFALCLIAGGWMVRNSLQQDRTGDAHLTRRNVRIAAPFILIFAWGFTFVSFDLMMSLSPHWYSTIFGIYCWAILFVGGVGMITMLVIRLKQKGFLEGMINEHHYHDLGKLLFAFTVFWAYIAFSQFMLIWYANLPEETFYMLTRLKGGWRSVSVALPIVKFAIPFFFLISRFTKRNEYTLFGAGPWLFLVQWLDIYWLVFPTFFAEPVFGWMEVGLFLGFAGLFLLAVQTFLSRVSVVAVKDPYLHEGLHHHQ